MRLPNFLIIGAQKAGTNWLAKMLNQHPDIFVYNEKEIHYFDEANNFRKGEEWYKRHFKTDKEYKFIGEKTPSYMWANLHLNRIENHMPENHMPDVHINIYSLLPDIKLIAILRNPVERAISHIYHLMRCHLISPLIKVDDIISGRRDDILKKFCILEIGLYYDQIQAYLEYFKREQMLFLIYESDVSLNPETGLKKVCQFLGADDMFEFRNLKEKVYKNTFSYPRLIVDYYIPKLRRYSSLLDWFFPPFRQKPNERALEKLYDFYSKPNKRLSQLLGNNLPYWRRNSSFS